MVRRSQQYIPGTRSRHRTLGGPATIRPDNSSGKQRCCESTLDVLIGFWWEGATLSHCDIFQWHEFMLACCLLQAALVDVHVFIEAAAHMCRLEHWL